MKSSLEPICSWVTPRGLYQPHIDGLRALAVMAVVFYHYSPKHFSGGFIGVDIFFVISGYLITGILVKNVKDHSYKDTLLDFYGRRIRRIFPAVALVVLFCLIIGWLAFFPSEYRELSKHIIAASVFVENILLWIESGYFDAGGMTKPFLHFWSLAVEEQFYIFWPFVLWFILRRRWPLMAAITAIAGCSFVLNVLSVAGGKPIAAFYLPYARAWELMVGAWLVVAQQHQWEFLRKWRNGQAWFGFALIFMGFMLIHPSESFPGYWAVLPVMGSALLINAGHEAFLNNRIMSWKPAVWIGLISYPLYLWHWVFLSLTVVIFGHLSGTLTGYVVQVGLIMSSIVFSWATYRWIETPVRRKKRGSAPGLAIIMAVLGVAGLWIYLESGFAGRGASFVSQQFQTYQATIERPSRDRSCYLQNGVGPLSRDWYCVLGDQNANQVLVAYGDSHSLSMMPALDRYGDAAHVKVLYAGGSGCPVLLGVRSVANVNSGKGCHALAMHAANLAKVKDASAVVLIERWTQYAKNGVMRPIQTGHGTTVSAEQGELPVGSQTGFAVLRYGLKRTARYYQELDIPLVLVRDNPTQRLKMVDLYARFRFKRTVTDSDLNQTAITVDEYQQSQADVNRLLETSASNFSSVSTLDLRSKLCNSEICPWVKDGNFLYYNNNHLSISGAMLVYPLLAKHLEGIL